MVKTLSACCVAGRLRMTPLAHHDAGLPTSSKQCSCFDAAAALLQPQRPLCHTCVPTHQTTRLWQPCTTPDKRVNPCAALPSACLPAAHATCHAQNDSSLHKSDPGMMRKRCWSAGVCAAPHNPARIGFAFFRRLGFSALPSAAERPPSAPGASSAAALRFIPAHARASQAPTSHFQLRCADHADARSAQSGASRPRASHRKTCEVCCRACFVLQDLKRPALA